MCCVCVGDVLVSVSAFRCNFVGPLFLLQAMIHRSVAFSNLLCFCNMQVESIVLSIISMLSSPNDESPANIEAAVSALDIILFA